MKKQLAISAGLALLGFVTVATAEAQIIYANPGYVGPGNAGPGYGGSEPALPPYEIMSIVRSTGLAPLTRPMRRGSYYVLVAVDRVGRQMRVVVDAQLGDIVNLRPALAAGSYSSYGPESGRPVGPPGTAASPPDVAGANTAYGPRPGGEPYGTRPAPHPGTETGLAPPRPIPNARPATAAAANAPAPGGSTSNEPAPSTRVAVAEPALPPAPPLPRPRPKLALNETPATAPVDAPAGPPAAKPVTPAATTTPAAAPGAAEDPAKSIE